MAVYFFSSIDEFDAWHTQVNAHYGYPDAHGTVRYTAPDVRSDGVYAQVLDDLPEQFRREDVGLPPSDEA